MIIIAKGPVQSWVGEWSFSYFQPPFYPLQTLVLVTITQLNPLSGHTTLHQRAKWSDVRQSKLNFKVG